MTFSNPATGLLNRSQRFSMLVEDGVVAILNVEPGREIVCSTGEALLEQV
jgi:peroxiredoxin